VNYLKNGEYKAEGGSFTEGIGIMRLVENFKQAKIDHAVTLPDQDLVTVSRYIRDHDGLVLGSSSALNVAGAIMAALNGKAGRKIVTFACDLGERSFSKLYNKEFLAEKGISETHETMETLIDRYKTMEDKIVTV